MPGMSRPAARDADHEFLRMMVDHHEGLIKMATAAMTQASSPGVQGDAHAMHTKQLAEQKEMISMVQTNYGESVTPMVTPSNKAMSDSVQGKSGTDYDRTFYRMIVQHHREALRMVQDFRSRVQRADVRQMMTKMESEQQQEIGELEAKLARLR